MASNDVELDQMTENEATPLSVHKNNPGFKRKESDTQTPRVVLSNINPNTIDNVSSVPVSEPALRIAPSPNPETGDFRKITKVTKRSNRNPVRFLEDPVVSASPPAAVPSEWQSSPSDTIIARDGTHRLELAGRTPKLRYPEY